MATGRIQVAAVGIQDYFISSNPDITYFKEKYNKHTKFALEILDNPFEDTVSFGRTITCVIPRKGDLIRNMYLRLELPVIEEGSDWGYTNSIGNAIIEHADLVIGGQLIERLTGEYMEIYNQLYISESQQKALHIMVGTTNSRTGLGPATAATGYPSTFLVPLPFYFNRVDSLNIPLSALTKQEVEVRIKLRPITQCVVSPTSVLPYVAPLGLEILNATLPVEYVFLDNSEINYFMNNRLDYLITQVQLAQNNNDDKDGGFVTEKQYRLNFVNPVKELYFAIQTANLVATNSSMNDWFNFGNGDPSVIQNPNYHQLNKLQLDFNYETIISSEVADATMMFGTQALLHHTRVPNTVSNCLVYTYSFAIDPEFYLPTGQVNMSRIQNQLLTLYLNATNTAVDELRNIRVYALSYNVLRIEDGMAGLLFIDNSR
jgi:hypothetical protein